MNRIITIIMLTCGFCLNANADIWKWKDEHGKSHFVDTKEAIYTWVDEWGNWFYSDTPDHEDAVSVELVWHAEGELADLEDDNGSGDSSGGGSKYIDPDETPEEAFEREQAEAYYCKRARQIYDSYQTAPRLYKTADDGSREYLSEMAIAAEIAETKKRVAKLCL